MFTSEAKQIAAANLRAARDSGDIAAVTEALKVYNVLVAKEDLTRERRRRSRAKREREAVQQALDTPPPFDGNEEFIEDDFKPYIPPPKPVAPPLASPPVPALEVEAPATPAAQMHGSGYTIVRKSAGLPWEIYDSPSCGPNVDDFSFAVFAPPQRAVTHAYSGGEWDELRARDARTAEQIAWQDQCEKLYGR